MLYKVLADITVGIHFLWILFLIFGALLGVRSKAIRVIHIFGLAFAFILQIFSWYCPLTYLEVWLRALHDPGSSYAGSFIIHYLEKIVYLEISQTVLFVMTICVGGITLWVYWRKPKARKSN